MKILVTGGTGFLGKRLASRLVEQGEVVVFSKETHPSHRIEFVTGDIRDKVALRKAFFGVDVVYHLAACLDESNPEIRDINVRGTRNVVELCRENKVKQIIYASTISVLGETQIPATEKMPYNPETEYEKSKTEAEKLVRNSGIPYTVIRAPIVIGPNTVWAAIFGAAKKKYPVIGSGKNLFHLVYVDDVVDLLVLVKNNRKAENQIFHVASKDINTYEKVYRMIADLLGIEMTKRHVPEWLALLLAGVHEWKSRIQGKRPELTRMKSSIKRLTRNRIVSTKKAREMLGFEARYSTAHALKETLKYLHISRLGYSDYDLAAISRIKDESRQGDFW